MQCIRHWAIGVCLLGIGVVRLAEAAPPDASVRPLAVDPARNKIDIVLDAPRVIAQGPADERRWGRFQFPTIARLSNGKLLIQFSAREDSVKGYSARAEYPNRAVSDDEGATWKLTDKVDGQGGLALPDGSRVSFAFKGSRPAAELALPVPAAARKGSYNENCAYYRADQLAPELRDCFIRRFLPAGGDQWQSSKAAVQLPGMLFVAVNGYFSFQCFLQYDATPWGTLMATLFPSTTLEVEGKVEDKVGVTLLESSDVGRTWQPVGRIPFHADPKVDPHAENRWQLHEPEFAFTPGGGMVCLIRSTDGPGVGPLYQSHSTDRGRTWTRPEVLDRLGVRPRLLVLKSGVTLATYGRPGLYLRASADPVAREWDAPVTLVAPGKVLNADTCGYASLLAVGPNQALVAYSHFTWPGDDGKPRKTILVQRITVRPRNAASAAANHPH